MSTCSYIENSIEPCEDCPRVISALYRCNLLKETAKEIQNDGE